MDVDEYHEDHFAGKKFLFRFIGSCESVYYEDFLFRTIYRYRLNLAAAFMVLQMCAFCEKPLIDNFVNCKY